MFQLTVKVILYQSRGELSIFIIVMQYNTHWYFINTIFLPNRNCFVHCHSFWVSFKLGTMLQRICYSHWANGARNGVISIGHWGVFNHEKGAIWQSHLAAQKEGVVTAIIFSNHKTPSFRLIKPPLRTPLQNTRLCD